MDSDVALSSGKFILKDANLNLQKDVALLRIQNGTIPPNDTAALPGFTPALDFDAVFLGINGSQDEQEKYAPNVRSSLQASIKALMPQRLSMTSEEAKFAIEVNRTLVQSGTNAPFITYKISSTPGSSGSAITIPNSNLLLGKS
jgi:hypothetical protein